MARIHKIIAYVVDANDEFEDAIDFINYANNTLRHGGHLEAFGCDTSRKFEWEDEIDVNQFGCTQEQYEKYFE